MSKLIINSVSEVCPDTEIGNIVAFSATGPEKAEKTEGMGNARAGLTRAGSRADGLVLNKQTARKLACEPGKAETLWRDKQLSGFILRCYANGRRVWLVQYRDASGATRRVNIGDAALIEADKARETARDLLAEARRGDPARMRDEGRRALKFGAAVEQYLAFAASKVKPSTLKETRRALTVHAGGSNRLAVMAVRRADVAELHSRVTTRGGAVAANRVLAALSAFFSWAMGRGIVEMNPVIKIPRNAEKARSRVLSNPEIWGLWAATGSVEGEGVAGSGAGDFGRIVRLLMLTGARRSEVGDMRWDEIDGNGLWTVSAARSKNGLAHEVPLSKLASAQLPERTAEGRFVFGRLEASGFSGWSKAKARLDARLAQQDVRVTKLDAGLAGMGGRADGAGFDDWSLHDLRRTFSTKLHDELGAERHIVEALLGHVSGHKSGVGGVYNKAGYRAQKAAALEAWARHLAEIVGEVQLAND